MTRRLSAFFVALVAMLTASAAHADGENRYLRRAQQSIDELDYEAARKALKKALRVGGSSVKELVTIYRLSGEVAAAFGFADEAESSFLAMLALDPYAEVAEGQAPKVVGPYDRAREFFASGDHDPLHVRVDRGVDEVLVETDSDPFDMVVAIRLYYRDHGELHRVEKKGDEASFELETWWRATAKITAVDKYGNELMEPVAAARVVAHDKRTNNKKRKKRKSKRSKAERTAEREPDDAPRADLVPDRDDRSGDEGGSSSRPLYARWYTWGAFALASGATAAYFGMQASRDWQKLDELLLDSTNHSYAEAVEVENRGHRNALIANVSFGAAAAFGAVSAVFLLRDLASDDGENKRRRITPVPKRRGLALQLELDF